MSPVSIVTGYLGWHYGEAFSDMFVLWRTFIWYTGHFFSMGLLMQTLFSPWKRMKEEFRRSDVEDFFATILVNTLSRIVGAIVRILFLIIGCLIIILLTVGFIALLVFWVIAPLALVASVLFGVALFF